MTDYNTAYRGNYDTQPEEDDPLAELARIVSGDVPANSSNPNVGQMTPKPQSVPAQDEVSNFDFAAALAEELDPAPAAAAQPQASPAAVRAVPEPSLEDQLLAEMGQGAEPVQPAVPAQAAPAAEPDIMMSRATPRPIEEAAAAPSRVSSEADAALARLEAVAQSLTMEQADAGEPFGAAPAAGQLPGDDPLSLQGMAVGNTLIDQGPEPQPGQPDEFADVEADLEAGFAEVFSEELGLDIADSADVRFDHETMPSAGHATDAIENRFADAFARELAIGADDDTEPQEMTAPQSAALGSDAGTFDPAAFQNNDFDIETDLPAAPVAARQSAGSNRGFRLAVGALIVALLVGTGVVAWGTFGGNQPGEGGEPPVIRADAEPAKVKPEDPGGKVIANQENQVYDRVSGAQGEENTQEELITSREQPVDVEEKSASRLSPDDEGEAAGTPLGLPPKKVRTLVVKPDGTIVANSEPESQAAPAEGAPLPLSTQPETLALAQSDASGDAEQAAAQQVEEPSVIALDGARSTGEIALPTPSPLPAPQQQAAAAPAPQPAAPKPAAAVSASPQPAAQSDPGAPTQIAAAAEVSQQPAARPAVTSSEWKIQVSSQRSREAAESSFSNIKQRFSSVLGNRTAAIERADIEGKGTFYRVKVLAQSKDDATNVCNRLKGAGGSCFVTR